MILIVYDMKSIDKITFDESRIHVYELESGKDKIGRNMKDVN